jgi:predicted dehydrogenase
MEYRFMPPISQLLEVVDSGDLGKIHMVHIREHRFPFLLKVANWNRFSKYTGGTLVEKCCHFWDLMRRIVGPDNEAVRVFASGGMDVNHKDEKYHLEDGKAPEVPDIVDNAFVIVEFSGGVRCCLDLCMFAEDRQHEEVSVVGSSGKVHAEAPACVVTHHTPSQRASGQGATKTRKPPMPGTYEKHTKVTEAHVDPVLLEAGYHEGATYYELEAFLKAVNDKTAPVVTVDDGFASVAIGIAAEVSIKEQRVVNMAEINAMIAQPDTGGAASQDEEPSKRQKKE